VESNDLCHLTQQIRLKPIRSHQQVQSLLAEYENLKEQKRGKEATQLLTDYSFHPYQNAFWKQPGSNLYIQMAPDLLHQFFLGIVKALASF